MRNDTPIYLAGGVRTAIGAYCGMFSDVPAATLGATAAKGALQAAGVPSDAVDELIFGNVLGAGLGPNVARRVTIEAGLDPSVGSTTVNKVCGSGLKSVMLAAQAIQCGDAEVVVAGGAESMTRAPYLLEKARTGYRMGHGEIIDAMIRDGLWDGFCDRHMGSLGEDCAAQYEFTREAQDDFAIRSYERANAAIAAGAFQSEIVPVEIASRKGTVTHDTDEEPGRFSPEKFRALRPAFSGDGTITAGNASSISDGAASVVVLSEAKLKEHGAEPQARVVGHATSSREPQWFTIAPVGAIQRLLDQVGWKASGVDLYEINEAFAVVSMAAIKDFALDEERVNVNGGAISLGHPIGASGCRILVTLLHAMKARDAKRGVAALCIGGGEAVAMAVERV
ncbi:MAG: acetyl-CoA C-acyltransferase [Akkermansiaceae bacterium]|nr:acetyl-CoA C-acyltransferase [Akkermansiaceae bacterium]